MKKALVMVALVALVAAMPAQVWAKEAEVPAPVTEEEEIDYFVEAVEDIDWDMEDMSDEEGVVYTQKEINYKEQTASWTVEMVDGSYARATIKDGMVHIEYKEDFYTVIADCTLEEYYEYDMM